MIHYWISGSVFVAVLMSLPRIGLLVLGGSRLLERLHKYYVIERLGDEILHIALLIMHF